MTSNQTTSAIYYWFHDFPRYFCPLIHIKLKFYSLTEFDALNRWVGIVCPRGGALWNSFDESREWSDVYSQLELPWPVCRYDLHDVHVVANDCVWSINVFSPLLHWMRWIDTTRIVSIEFVLFLWMNNIYTTMNQCWDVRRDIGALFDLPM